MTTIASKITSLTASGSSTDIDNIVTDPRNYQLAYRSLVLTSIDKIFKSQITLMYMYIVRQLNVWRLRGSSDCVPFKRLQMFEKCREVS